MRSGSRSRSKKDGDEPPIVLQLYVAGHTARSERAIRNLRQFCEKHLEAPYRFEVIDIHQQPVLARGEQIVAAPTLIKKLPAPLRKVVGDLSDSDRVLMGLDLRPMPPGPESSS